MSRSCCAKEPFHVSTQKRPALAAKPAGAFSAKCRRARRAQSNAPARPGTNVNVVGWLHAKPNARFSGSTNSASGAVVVARTSESPLAKVNPAKRVALWWPFNGTFRRPGSRTQ